MSNLTLVVDNRESIKHRVLKNLMNFDGKLVSMFVAIRHIESTEEATSALEALLHDGLIERREVGPHRLIYYRYRNELAFYRRGLAGKLHKLTS